MASAYTPRRSAGLAAYEDVLARAGRTMGWRGAAIPAAAGFCRHKGYVTGERRKPFRCVPETRVLETRVPESRVPEPGQVEGE
jgi:hypothetical protein